MADGSAAMAFSRRTGLARTGSSGCPMTCLRSGHGAASVALLPSRQLFVVSQKLPDVRAMLGTFFCGEWKDNHGSIVKVVLKGGSPTATFDREERKSIRLPVHIDKGRWVCGAGVLQTNASSPSRISWLCERRSKKQYTWRRNLCDEADEYLQHTPFMTKVNQFYRTFELVAEMSMKAIAVPVWALRFTQYNINENLKFSDGKDMFDMLNRFLHHPKETP